MPSCVLVLDFVPDLLRDFGALSAGSSLGGSGSWIDSADSLDISSALVFSREGSELDVSACAFLGGVCGLIGCDSVGGLCDFNVGDGRGDGKCVVIPVTVAVAGELSIRTGLSAPASPSIAPPLDDSSPDGCRDTARLGASGIGSAAYESRSSEMPRPVPLAICASPSSILHYDPERQLRTAMADNASSECHVSRNR